ncbi:hypothetical protein ZIOFF_040835 [Zingiber officinale]|uniref:Uncharacterized protein n=1 Tax=Zingiber officinale TaxID=94328 RepID=A0A8J5GI04_ZINOF|nr:hypothetical protein ZIOFF_040835 [Zingiber officinale]
MDGRISLSFSNYTAAQPSEEPNYNNKDEEVYETLAVLIETQPGAFTYFDGTTEEYYKAYGDLDDHIVKGKQIIDQDERYSSQTEPHILVNKISQHAVLPKRQTEVSAGLDIAATSRSGLSWKYGVEVGAGVIDSDYRGEVPHLSYTERGEKGFGSTDTTITLSQNNQARPCSDYKHRGSVPRSMEPTLDYEENDDSYLDYIQYLTSLSSTNKPMWDDYPDSDTEFLNPFASEGGGISELIVVNCESELIAANCEMEYPCLQ